MADDPNAMLAALTGAPPLPPRKPAEFQAPEGAYEDPDTDAAEQDMIADQMGSRGNEAGLTQEQLQDLIAKKGDMRASLERLMGRGEAPAAAAEDPTPRSMMAVDGYRQPEGIFNNRVIDRRNPFMSQSGGQNVMSNGRGVQLPTYAVPTKQADRFFSNRWDLPHDPLIAKMKQEGDEGDFMDNVMGSNDKPQIDVGLSREPEDVALRQFVASRMNPKQLSEPRPSGPMALLSRLMGR
jgi:hypothetical protein